jgi:hypothetical protein
MSTILTGYYTVRDRCRQVILRDSIYIEESRQQTKIKISIKAQHAMFSMDSSM